MGSDPYIPPSLFYFVPPSLRSFNPLSLTVRPHGSFALKLAALCMNPRTLSPESSRLQFDFDDVRKRGDEMIAKITRIRPPGTPNIESGFKQSLELFKYHEFSLLADNTGLGTEHKRRRNAAKNL
ncbi:hypothetical protein NQZ68_007634 [Dissostichus eleginoides]|nr:hypothetical protein NQZ68_007634 [Dissostichus eleginoides]